MCNQEIMGKDHTLKFVCMTRWRNKDYPLLLHYRPTLDLWLLVLPSSHLLLFLSSFHFSFFFSFLYSFLFHFSLLTSLFFSLLSFPFFLSSYIFFFFFPFSSYFTPFFLTHPLSSRFRIHYVSMQIHGCDFCFKCFFRVLLIFQSSFHSFIFKKNFTIEKYARRVKRT